MTREDIEKKMHESAEEIKPLVTTLVEALCEAHQKGYLAGVELGAKMAYPQWIPVEERLPEEVSEIHHCSTDVLIGYFADGDNYQTTARYNCKEKVWYDADDWGEIDIPTHWMLLPQPPRKRSEI